MRFALNLLALIAAVDAASKGSDGAAPPKRGILSRLTSLGRSKPKTVVGTAAAPVVTPTDVDMNPEPIQSAEPEQPRTEVKPEETMFTMTNILGLGAILAVIAGVAFFTFSK